MSMINPLKEPRINVECLGCRIANGIEPNLNIVYENEWVTCVLDIDPFNEGHTLILPKQHFLDVDEMDTETAHAVMDASQKLAAAMKKLFKPDGVRVCQADGKFSDLTHYHMHVFPSYEGDGFVWSESLREDGASKRLSQTKEKMVQTLSEL